MTTINALNKNTSWKSKHKPKKVEVGVSVPKHGEISCQADTADTMISRQRLTAGPDQDHTGELSAGAGAGAATICDSF